MDLRGKKYIIIGIQDIIDHSEILALQRAINDQESM
jgi:hypothetical protein